MFGHRFPAVTSMIGAGLAASCCILPMAFIAAGLASAGLMMSMMRYEWLTLPLGVTGLVAAVVVYTRRRQQCATNGCRFVGQRLNQLFLVLGTIVVVASLLLRVFSSWTSEVLAAITS
jgi:heme/copper-type cytochrome/quinol oxidase subunit 2